MNMHVAIAPLIFPRTHTQTRTTKPTLHQECIACCEHFAGCERRELHINLQLGGCVPYQHVMCCGQMQAKPMTLATWLPSRHGRRSTAVVLAHRAARGWPHVVRAPGLVAMGTSSQSVQQAMHLARSSGLAYRLTEANTNSLWRRRSGSANMTSGKSETCSVRWRCPWGSGINIQM